jgi:hypothetical protein
MEHAAGTLSRLDMGAQSSKNTTPVVLPRKSQPVYVLGSSSRNNEPSGLLPMKAAAYKQYPNLFNASCGFFGSIGRDLQRGKPCSIVRVSKVALDLAKVLMAMPLQSLSFIFICQDSLFKQFDICIGRFVVIWASSVLLRLGKD